MSGSATNITMSIRTFLKDSNTNYNVDELKAIGCDGGTVINTGAKNVHSSLFTMAYMSITH